jgi:hypothetical protein
LLVAGCLLLVAMGNPAGQKNEERLPEVGSLFFLIEELYVVVQPATNNQQLTTCL